MIICGLTERLMFPVKPVAKRSVNWSTTFLSGSIKLSSLIFQAAPADQLGLNCLSLPKLELPSVLNEAFNT